jgi:hypothetical protein
MLLWSSESMLTIDGFNDAIVVRPDLTPAFDKANRLFDLSSIISICSGLVLLIRIDDIDLLSLSFAHSSVRDFLLSPEVPSPFKSQLEERVARVTILRTCFAYLTCLDWEFDDVVEFTREHQFAVCSNDIWPRQARALEATDDEALALIIGFLESDLHNSTPFFRFTYPRIAPSGQEWCALYVAATEGLVRSCRHLIQHGRALVKSLLEDSALELGLYFKNTGRLVGVDIDRIIKDLLIGSRLDNALVTASLNGHDDIVRDLLHHGASASAMDQCNFLTPPGGSALFAAAEYGHLEVVKMLVRPEHLSTILCQECLEHLCMLPQSSAISQLSSFLPSRRLIPTLYAEPAETPCWQPCKVITRTLSIPSSLVVPTSISYLGARSAGLHD